jgi:tetratricopeptide (TPR) repeat protein/V8-like Glu-specific endopeptidase
MVISISPVVSLAGENVDSYFEIPPENLPISARELFSQALQQQKINNLEFSIDLWSRYLKMNPRSFRGYNNLGMAHFANDHLSLAISSFETGLVLKPIDRKIRDNLKRTLRFQVTLLRENKDYDAGIHFLKRIAELSVESEREKVALEIETMEDRIFEEVKRSNTLEDYEAFLNRYPNSPKNSDEARRLIARRKSPVTGSEGMSVTQEEEKAKRKNLEDAQEKVRLYPNNADAHYLLGIAYGKLDQYQDAIAPLKEAIRIQPYHYFAHKDLGIGYFLLDQHQEAIPYFKEAIRIKSDDADIQYLLGGIYSEIGQHQEAIPYLKEAIRIKPDFYDAHFNLGLAYQYLGQYQEAVAEYKDTLRINPGNTQARANLDKIELMIATEKPVEELSHDDELKQMVGKETDERLKKGELEDAQEQVRLDPYNALAHSILGFRYMELVRYQEAIAPLKEAIRLNPNDPVALINLGWSYNHLNRSQEAIAPLKEAIRLDPYSAHAHNNLGWSYSNLDRYQEAIAPLKEAISLDPDLSVAYGHLSDSYIRLARYHEAIASLKEVIRRLPKFSLAYSNLGWCYYKLGQYQEAIAPLKESIRLDPSDVLPYSNLGWSYMKLVRYQEAIAPLQEAIRLNPNAAIIYVDLAYSYGRLGRYQEAIAPLKEAIRLKPNVASVHFNLGWNYSKLDRHQEAIAPLKESIRLDPSDAVAHNNLGWSYQKLGHFPKAIAEYKEALRINPNLTIAFNNLDALEPIPEWKKRILEEDRGKLESLQNKNEADRLARERKLLEEERKKLEALYLAVQKEKQKPSQKKPTQPKTGSGFYISKMGHVITNAHVVQNCSSVTVGDNANKQIRVKIIRTDKSNDLALLKLSTLEMDSTESKSIIQKLSISVIPLVTNGLLRSEDVRLGEKILVAGYPFGNLISNTMKFTSGIVSATFGAGDDSGQFQIDAAIQPGNSGGPIYDNGGNIVGIVVSQLNKLRMVETLGAIPENQNFGIKASTVRQFLESSGLPSKKVERTKDIPSDEVAKIAENQALLVICFQ